MFFFRKFPRTEYSFIETPTDKKTAVNILSAFFLSRVNSKNKYSPLQTYEVREGDIVESVSENLYQSPLYYWVLLLNNNIVNPFTEWPQSTYAIQLLTEKKYKNGIKRKLANGTEETVPISSGLEGIHHFEDDLKNNSICDDMDDADYRTLWQSDPLSIPENILPVTNFQYEIDKNNSRRTMNVVNPASILTFVEDFSMLLSSFPKGA